jgi:hypothetical protein
MNAFSGVARGGAIRQLPTVQIPSYATERVRQFRERQRKRSHFYGTIQNVFYPDAERLLNREESTP